MAKFGLFLAQTGIVLVALAAIVAWPITLVCGIIAAIVGAVLFARKV